MTPALVIQLTSNPSLSTVKLSLTPSLAPVFACAALVVLAGGAQAYAQMPAVGEVTLHIGQALVVSASGAQAAVRRGSPVHPGDRIETAEGGHVHIRFVDGALVSVRPTSRLVIEDYQYNPQQVAQSLVRFRLEKGVTRAISGAAAEGAKERFRLNTPLVAIGIRGTDFVVRTQLNQTIATVHQGAIVMAPFGEGCSPQALGPCGSPTARLLSADMGNMLVEFRSTLAQPELKPFNGVKPPDTLLAAADPQPAADAASAREAAKPAARPSSVEDVSSALMQEMVRKAGDVPPGPAQLAWGRWGAGPLGASDFSVPRGDARAGRVVTVGDNDFILYRTDNGTTSLPVGLGNVSFALQQAHAQFTSHAQDVQAASVEGGSLSINFSSRQFSTALSLSSAATGKVGLEASGFVRDDGMFNARSATQAVAGASALDGKSVGYLFQKATAGGTLSGMTLWGR